MTLFRPITQPKCATITLFPHMPFFRHQRVPMNLRALYNSYKDALLFVLVHPPYYGFAMDEVMKDEILKDEI